MRFQRAICDPPQLCPYLAYLASTPDPPSPSWQGDMDNAKKCFKHAIQCSPQHLEAHFNMGNLYRQCAEFGRAIIRCGCMHGPGRRWDG